MFLGSRTLRHPTTTMGATPLKQRALIVIGMAFFWPFIKGPNLAHFLGKATQSPLAAFLAVVMCGAFLCLACVWMRTTLRLMSSERLTTQTSQPVSTLATILLGYLLSFVVELPVDLLPDEIATPLILLMPIVSGVAAWGAERISPLPDIAPTLAKEEGRAGTPSLQPMWLLAGIAALTYATSGVLLGMYSTAPVPGNLLSVGLAVPFVLCALLPKGRSTFSALLWCLCLVPLIMSALFVIVPTGNIFTAGLNLLTASRRGAFILLWPLLAECALASRSPMRTALWGAGGYVGMYLAVRALIAALRAIGIEATLSAEALRVATLVVALIIVACSLAIIAVAARTNGSQDTTNLAQAPETTEAPTEHDLRHAACQAIASQAALTEMEALALEFVSMGYTVARIAQERGVTENTVRTHTKGLYRKLDVHSKQEVIELVEARMAEEN